MCIGNAAIVLRSRLKVRVLKENWEKKARVDEKGIILTNGDIENSRKAVQHQVWLVSLCNAKSIRAVANINIHSLLINSRAQWLPA